MTRSSSPDPLEPARMRRLAHAAAWVLGTGTAAFVSTKAATWGVTTVATLLLSSMVTGMAHTPPGGRLAYEHTVDAEIVKTTDTYRDAVLAGDARAVAAVYRDDAVELQPCRTPVRGRAAIEQRYRNLFNSSARVTAFTFSHIDAMTDGNLAYDVGTYEQRLALRSGDTMTDAGKYLVILRRTQGEWKAAYAIYSSDAGSAQ